MAEIKIIWQGAEYRIPDDQAFQIGERVEAIATLDEILSWLQRPRFYKMARCLGEMLRFAGCKVGDKEIHTQLVAQVHRDTDASSFGAAVFALVDLLMGDAPRDSGGKGDNSGKPASSSKRPSRSR